MPDMSGSTWHTLSSVLLGTCWGGVGVVWILGALYNVRHGPRVRERSWRDPRWLLALAAILLIYGDRVGIDWGTLTVSSPWLRAPGVAVLLAATAFTLWARVALGTMWSSAVVAKSGHVLRTDGPYSITRHPIYTGLAGMLLGTALIEDLGRWAALLVLCLVYFALKARAEETLLSGMFPEYEDYRERVPRLMPLPHQLGWLLRR
jgi:protein-S-isoprenylcysteine O-methyltransferase Ste14